MFMSVPYSCYLQVWFHFDLGGLLQVFKYIQGRNWAGRNPTAH